MIEFRKLVLKNFMSYKDKTVVQLANQGIVRIEGINEDDPAANSNMAGKSTIMEALTWCLFGKTLRGLKHEQIVNRRARKDCHVSTTFRIGGIVYLCRRFRKHRQHSNKLLLFREGTPLSSRHNDDTQSRLENILGCDFQGFINSTVFGGFDGAKKPFALLTDREQKGILDSFLHFEKFEIALKRTKHELQESRERYRELEIKLVRLNERTAASKIRVRDLRKSLRDYEIRERSERRTLQKQIKKLKEVKGPFREELKEARDKLEKDIIKRAGAVENRSEIQRQLSDISRRRKHREKMIGKPCPTCGQSIRASTLSSLLKHLKRDRRSLRANRTAIQETIERLERKVAHGRDVVQILQHKQEKYQNSLEVIKQMEERVKESGGSRSSIMFSAEIEEACKRYSKEVSRLLVCESEAEQLQSKISGLEFWEIGFGNRGVKTLIVREVLPTMNQKLREYARQIFQSNVELEFRPSKSNKRGEERELFHLHYSTRRNSNTYIGESSGGRRRIDICCLLVFSWLARTSNLLLVDELLDGLDDEGRERVLSILSQLRGTVLVISHNKEIKSRIGTVWTVRKRQGISTLEVPT